MDLMGWPTRRSMGILVIGLFFLTFTSFFFLRIGFFISGILFSLVFWSFLRGWNCLGGIRCERQVQEETMEGEEVPVILRLGHSANKKEVTDLLIKDSFPPAQSESPVFIYSPKVSLKTPQEFSYSRICDKRGVYTLGPVVLKSADRYGCFAQKKTFPLKSRMVVYPKIFDLSSFPTLSRGTTAQMGLSSGKREGDSGDYFAIREYQQGDTLKNVHWRATARNQSLFVKQFERLADSEVTLFLDLDPASNIGRGSESALEASIRLSASIAKYLMLKDILVQLIAHQEQPILLPLGKGHEHLANCLEILATLSANGKLSLAELIEEYEEQVAPDTTVVVSLLDTDREAISALAILRQKGVAIVLLVFISDAFRVSDPNYRLEKLPFADLYAHLGAQVYVVRPYGYEELVRQFNESESLTPYS